MTLRAVAAAALALALVAAAAASCDDTSVDPSADSGTDDGASLVSPSQCPAELPVNGSTCTLAENTTCAFGTCATYAVCSRSVWTVAPRPGQKNVCPPLVPDEGTACGDCFEDGGACTYGDPTCADASRNAAVAACRQGKFSIRIVTCIEGGTDAASTDGGRDAPEGG